MTRRSCVKDSAACWRSMLDLRMAVEAADGEQALRALRDSTVDVLLLDVRMPRMTGMQVLRALAASGCLPPTIVLTTFDDDEALVGMSSGRREGVSVEGRHNGAAGGGRTDRRRGGNGDSAGPDGVGRSAACGPRARHPRRLWSHSRIGRRRFFACSSQALVIARSPTPFDWPKERSRTTRRAFSRSSASGIGRGPSSRR